ncbi:MAG: DUF1499 domain-containing protein [Minwuia sp.]|nr:DUF1499 domain-containing protein [Minwuia sp.]
MDFANLKLSRKPNQFLMAPPGLCQMAQPHADSPVFPMTPAELMQRVDALARGEDRVSAAKKAPDGLSATYVARSKVFRFPDIIDISAQPHEDGGATLAIYSRARYGVRDFGVNRARIEDWISRLK